MGGGDIVKKILKFGCIGFIGIFLIGLIGGILGVVDNSDPVNTSSNDDSNQVSETDKLEQQKEYYMNNTKPKIEELTNMYDKIWNEGWRPTFEALSNSNVDIYAAYNNLKIVRDTYRELSKSFDSIPVEGLSDEHQETLKKAFREFSGAAVSRQIAAEKALEMIDERNYAPSHVNRIQDNIEHGDQQMMSSVLAITAVEMELGIIEIEQE